jgi:DNA-binding MarR family transcriptional regulator
MVAHKNDEELEKLAQRIKKTRFYYIYRFADTIIRYIEITLRKNNSNRLQGAVMLNLAVRGGKLTTGQIARDLGRSKYNITPIIDRLVKKGLVTRGHTNKDRRITYIKITSAGISDTANTLRKANNWTREVINTLDVTEQKSLIDKTEKLQKKIAEIINKSNST